MLILMKNIRTPVSEPDAEITACALRQLRPVCGRSGVRAASVYKRSIDARKRERICFVSSVLIETAEDLPAEALAKLGADVFDPPVLSFEKGAERLSARPVVVGFGPAGMFAALLLAEQGYRPIVLERGADIEARTHAVENFYRTGALDPETNVQFGAGGAGTFSDGKLVTRIHDPYCRLVLERFRAFGAPEEVLTCAKPHVGTDRLRGIVAAIRDRITALGGTVRFGTRVTDLILHGDQITAVATSAGQLPCGALILAVGHSARDVYEMLKQKQLTVQPKPFSVGVRIEHLQTDIDRALFGEFAGDPRLGRGEYALSHREGERAVYTFCMCPGGEVIAAASETGGVVTNGMSNYRRDGKNANAAIAVSVTPDDCAALGLDPMGFQRKLEQAAYALGGGNYRAPVMTVGDYLAGKHGSAPTRVAPSYMGGGRGTLADLAALFPADINRMLRTGLRVFDRQLPGFAAPYAVLTGPETRTSAPYRVLRGDAYTAAGCDNLYPSGEGAGYAGGITSAAVDGMRCAAALMKRYAAKD